MILNLDEVKLPPFTFTHQGKVHEIDPITCSLQVGEQLGDVKLTYEGIKKIRQAVEKIFGVSNLTPEQCGALLTAFQQHMQEVSPQLGKWFGPLFFSTPPTVSNPPNTTDSPQPSATPSSKTSISQ